MIRRETLSMPPDGPTYLDAMREVRRVQRGESVRIIGLGTLANHCRCPGLSLPPCPSPVYRLTLTAAVAKKWRDRSATARQLWQKVYTEDVRHLARALGAPVEVWAPKGIACITTVRP